MQLISSTSTADVFRYKKASIPAPKRSCARKADRPGNKAYPSRLRSSQRIGMPPRPHADDGGAGDTVVEAERRNVFALRRVYANNPEPVSIFVTDKSH